MTLCCTARYVAVSIARKEKQGQVTVPSPESSHHHYAGTAALSTPSSRAAFSPLRPPKPPQADVSKNTPLALEKGKDTGGANTREDVF